MPALPERGDVTGLVGAVEIQRKFDVQHAGQPDRHVGVAGKVEVDLQRIGQGRVPGLEEGQAFAGRRGVEAGVGEAAERVGQHQLLGQPEEEQGETGGEVLSVGADDGGVAELRDDIAGTHDRTGDQMREESDEGGVGQGRDVVAVPAVRINQEHHLLKGEEADGQRQKDVQRRLVGGEDVPQEVGVFEPAQQAQVEDQTGDQPAARRGPPPCHRMVQNTLADDVIAADGAGQQQHEGRVPPAVEEQARPDQPRQRPARIAPAAQQEEPGEAEGQEAQDERGGIEQHGARRGAG